MKILITNDDGYKSEGLQELSVALSKEHEVLIVAPDSERSGFSHSISLHGPVVVKKINDHTFSCDGTPADCVIIATVGMKFIPDVVVSGINRGPNVGTDIIYSGTVAAARQAALMDIPGIAVSLYSYTGPFYYTPLAEYVAREIDSLVGLWSADHLININGPNVEKFIGDILITKPSRRLYNDKMEKFTGPDGREYFFFTDASIENLEVNDFCSDPDLPTDIEAIENGSISVAPIYLHPVNSNQVESYRKLEHPIGIADG